MVEVNIETKEQRLVDRERRCKRAKRQRKTIIVNNCTDANQGRTNGHNKTSIQTDIELETNKNQTYVETTHKKRNVYAVVLQCFAEDVFLCKCVF